MWSKYGTQKIGYTTNNIIELIESINIELSNDIKVWLDEPDSIPLESCLSQIGYKIKTISTPLLYTGLKLVERSGKYIVERVLAGSPAMKAGLAINDEILAIECYRVSGIENWERLLNKNSDNEILYSRRGLIRNAKLSKLSSFVLDKEIINDSTITQSQLKLRNSWLEFA